ATITRESLAVAREQSLAVHGWTVNDPEEMSSLLQLGVHGVITDRADVALQVLADRTEPGPTG
ncbi:MAG: glycerophosphodiester phosphodiesterase family protein, partial [Angustibacter sp.]